MKIILAISLFILLILCSIFLNTTVEAQYGGCRWRRSINATGIYFDGNVGIGDFSTSSPLGKLDVRGDIFTDQWLNDSTNTFLGIGVAGDGNLAHSSGSQGWQNTGIGYNVFKTITTGYRNTVMGHIAGDAITTGFDNVLLGWSAGTAINAGQDNVAIGKQALVTITSGDRSVAIGTEALKIAAGSGNIGIGYRAGDAVNGAGAYNILIGFDVDAPITTGTYQLNIGNLIYGNTNTNVAGINTSTPTSMFDVAGGIVSSVCDTVASATNITLTNFNNFLITGTTQIDSITIASTVADFALIYLEFNGSCQVTDGNNLKLAGNFSGTDDDILILQKRGAAYYQVSGSNN